MHHHRCRHRAKRPGTVQAARHHVDEPFLPERQERRLDVERGDGHQIGVERRGLPLPPHEERRHRNRGAGNRHRRPTPAPPLRPRRRLAQCERQIARSAEAVLLRRRDRAEDNGRELGRHVTPKRQRATSDLRLGPGDCLRRRRSREQPLARQHLEEDTAERVHVAPSVHFRRAERLLGTHVRRRAEDDRWRRERVVGGAGHGARDAEIGDDGVPLVQQDVAGLDVQMHDAATMRVIERERDLATEPDDVVDR